MTFAKSSEVNMSRVDPLIYLLVAVLYAEIGNALKCDKVIFSLIGFTLFLYYVVKQQGLI